MSKRRGIGSATPRLENFTGRLSNNNDAGSLCARDVAEHRGLSMDTDPEVFIRWALDDARTLEERYTTELLIERLEDWYNAVHQTGKHRTLDQTMARTRE